MSDIRKDFERFYDSLPTMDASDDWAKPYIFTGFQAGRAHDVDGLIAEINKCPAIIPDGFSSLLLYQEDVIEIIRRHFGKE